MQKAVFLLLVLAVWANAQQISCRFAPKFTANQLLTNETARNQFLSNIAFNEGHFHSPGVGYNGGSAHTYDGHPLDYNTGQLIDSPHPFSAPSKESIHVAMLALAIAGNPWAMQFVAAGANATLTAAQLADPRTVARIAVASALDILTTKIATYEQFNAQYPALGGYFPWINVHDDGIVPSPDWLNPPRVPSLDNGELVWALYATVAVLQSAGQPQLAARYQAQLDLMAKFGVMVFHDGGGRIRAVTILDRIDIQPTPGNYHTSSQCGDPCYLDDPYEGELFVQFLDLFGVWPDPKDRAAMWTYKQQRNKLQSVDYSTPAGPITVQRGWWFSAHEQWKFLLTPYTDNPTTARVFANGERARSWNAFLKGYVGMFASVNDVTNGNEPIPDYVSATGVQEIAFEEVDRVDIVTPYGAFPTILASPGVGLAWYRNMLAGPRMQGPFGSTEAVTQNGTNISPLTTWDAKITTVVAAFSVGNVSSLADAREWESAVVSAWLEAAGTDAGAISEHLRREARDRRRALFAPDGSTLGMPDLVRSAMQAQGVYSQFVGNVASMYERVFTSLRGERLGFQIPAAAVPLTMPDWAACSN